MKRIVALVASVLSLGACGIGPEDLNDPDGVAQQDLGPSTGVRRATTAPPFLGNICSRIHTEQLCEADALCKWVEVDDGQPGGPTSSTGGHVIIGGLCILAVEQDPPTPAAARPIAKTGTPTTAAVTGNVCSRIHEQAVCEADVLCKWLEVDASGKPASSASKVIVGGLCILAVEQDPPPPSGGSASHP